MEDAFVTLIDHLQQLKNVFEHYDYGDFDDKVDTDTVGEYERLYYKVEDVVESWTSYQDECKKSLTVTRQSLPALDPQQQP